MTLLLLLLFCWCQILFYPQFSYHSCIISETWISTYIKHSFMLMLMVTLSLHSYFTDISIRKWKQFIFLMLMSLPVYTVYVCVYACAYVTCILSFHQSCDQNKNRNHSMKKVKSLRYDRRLTYKQPCQESGLCCFSFARYLQKCVTQIYRALYGDAMFVSWGTQTWQP